MSTSTPAPLAEKREAFHWLCKHAISTEGALTRSLQNASKVPLASIYRSARQLRKSGVTVAWMLH